MRRNRRNRVYPQAGVRVPSIYDAISLSSDKSNYPALAASLLSQPIADEVLNASVRSGRRSYYNPRSLRARTYDVIPPTADYDLPDYADFASHLLAQPQRYGLDGAMGVFHGRNEDLDASLRSCERTLYDLDRERNQVAAELEETVEEVRDITHAANDLIRQRDDIVRASRAMSTIKGARPRRRGVQQIFDELLNPIPRRRPWYRVHGDNIRQTAMLPVNKVRSALERREARRQRMKKWVVPSYADEELAEEYRDWEWYRVQDLFDTATPRQLRKLLKDPYYRAYYDGEISFWGD